MGTDLGAWDDSDGVKADLEGVGVNTGFVSINRLTVASLATMLSHEGPDYQG